MALEETIKSSGDYEPKEEEAAPQQAKAKSRFGVMLEQNRAQAQDLKDEVEREDRRHYLKRNQYGDIVEEEKEN